MDGDDEHAATDRHGLGLSWIWRQNWLEYAEVVSLEESIAKALTAFYSNEETKTGKGKTKQNRYRCTTYCDTFG